MQGKKGKRFVKGDLWSTRTAKPGSDLLQEIAMAYRGSSIGQLCTKHTRRGSPARRTGLPAGLILKGAHITEGTVKEHETHISILSPLLHPEFFISFENKVLSHVGESSFIYSPSKKAQASKHCQGLLPWKWPLHHKQAPALTRRDSRSEWALKWVKVLAFLNSILAIKREGARILNTLLFRTVSDPSFLPIHPVSVNFQWRKEGKKQWLLKKHLI